MDRVICFGAGGGGRREKNRIQQNYKILCFTDNDPQKWGGSIEGIPIVPPTEALDEDFDYVVITSQPGLQSIMVQLNEAGIPDQKIITSFVDYELRARIEWLKSFAIMHQNDDKSLQCAEAGVFEGDFAKYINSIFPDRKLFLFDTFEGFSQSDIDKESSDYAKAGDYSNTSVVLVMSKMKHPENVEIHKGFFPDSAKDTEGSFLFVNLDLDLYEPTIQGLRFFKDKMSSGAAILVHDYFAETFDGPKRAVDEFIAENRALNYHAYPIGDKLSALITGF